MNDITRVRLVMSLARDAYDGETGARHTHEVQSLSDVEKMVYRSELHRLRTAMPATEWATYRGEPVSREELMLYGAQAIADGDVEPVSCRCSPPLRQPATPPRYYDPAADRWLWGFCAASALLVLWIIALAIGVRP